MKTFVRKLSILTMTMMLMEQMPQHLRKILVEVLLVILVHLMGLLQCQRQDNIYKTMGKMMVFGKKVLNLLILGSSQIQSCRLFVIS